MILTPTFKSINTTAIDLLDIVPVRADGETLSSKNKVRVQKLSTTGAFSTQYQYTTASGGKWSAGSTQVARGDVTFAAGEAMAVYNSDALGSGIVFTFSGEVELNPVSTSIAPQQYGLIGNLTPSTVDLMDIVPYVDGVAITSSKNKVRIQKLSSAGAFTTQYQYTTSGNKWQSGSTAIVRGDVTFAPGEAMAVYNAEAAKTITLKFPSPVTAE